MSTINKEFDKKVDTYYSTSIDPNIHNIRMEADANAGFSVLPNLTLGVRLAYKIW